MYVVCKYGMVIILDFFSGNEILPERTVLSLTVIVK